MEAAVALLQGLGLSTAAGLRSYLTLLAVGLVGRYTDLIQLSGPYDLLEHPVTLTIMAVLALGEFVGDKIPVVDHLLHAVETLVNPAAGVIVALAAGDAAGVHPVLAGMAGLIAAGGAHGTRAVARPASTAGTGGWANPLISFAEDVLAAIAIAVAFLAPLLVLVLLAGLAWIAWRVWKGAGKMARNVARGL